VRVALAAVGRRLLALALAAAVAVGAIACGGGGGGGDGGSPADRADEAGEAGEAGSTAEESTTTAAPTTTTDPSATTTEPPTTAPVDVAALQPPAPAADPASLARQIADAEAALRRTDASQSDIAAAALAQQVGYRQLGDHPEWDAAVLAALPPSLVAVAEGHAAARRDLRGLTGDPATEMPAWRIVAPAPASELTAWYREAEAGFGVPWQILAAINLVETAMGRIRGTSVAGAQGPMQFLPETWAAYGEGDVNDPRQAIRGAARYLVANGAPGDMAGALWNYNHSDRYVRAVLRYAHLMSEHPGAFAAFHAWGVWYWTTAGDIYLPIGWEARQRVPVDQYRATAEPGR
jgi:membrane-bound lytic murein transglycosylase B